MSTIASSDPLLTTKIYIPPPRPKLVHRPRLTTKLDLAWERKLTVISAPAGFGKTTLLSEWIDNASPDKQTIVNRKSKIINRVAWLSLDEGDNDPARFLSYLIAALQGVQPEVGRAAAFTSLNHPDTRLSSNQLQAIVTTLINEITATFSPFVLILDDFHLINAPSLNNLIAFFLDHLPPPLHLIIASRTEATLPLARLRVEGQLLQLSTADLRFTPAEAATFLNQVMDLDLAPAHIATLETRTEGWIAGLQLAALSMQDRQDIAAFITSFTGSHHYIFDYLAEEVLNRQPPAIQQFLLQTSLLNRMCGPLCDAVTEFTIHDSRFTNSSDSPDDEKSKIVNPKSKIQNSHQMLTHLEQANLFIIPLDEHRHWYRYHHLFVEFLRNRLEQTAEVEDLTALHRRAAEWYEAHDLAAEAAGHALAMADVDRAARLIAQRGRSVLNRSEMSTLLSWIEALPRELITVRPRLSLFHAWALVLTGQLEAVEARVQDAERSLREGNRAADIPGELTAIRATLAYFRRDFPQAISLYREALAKLPPENLFLRGAVAMSLATACNLHGDLAEARQAFREAEDIQKAGDNAHMVLIAILNMGLIDQGQGQLHQAAAGYQRGIKLIERQMKQGQTSPIAGRIYVGLAEVLVQWHELEPATVHLEQARTLAEKNDDPITQVSCNLVTVSLWQAQGKYEEATSLLAQTDTFCQHNDLPGWRVRLAVAQLHLALHRADLADASAWLHRAQIHLQQSATDDSAGYPYVLQELTTLAEVRLLLAQNRLEAATALFTSLQQAFASQDRQGHLLETTLLQVLLYQRQGQEKQALDTLETTLFAAEPERYIRLFAAEPGVTEDLLRRVRARGTATGYIDQILQAKKQGASHTDPVAALIEPLSERELEILQLIDEGLSNQQISEKLFLTVGTVKWHINNIYGKLGVRRRTQALARARELKVL